MNVDAVSTTSAMAAAVRQLQTISELQVETMKQLAESQQQMAAVIAREGVGQNVNVTA